MIVLATAAPAAATFATLFGPGAILQRGRPLPIFGSGTPGTAVEVRLGSARAKGFVGRDGRWSVLLAATKAKGGTLELRFPGGRIASPDVRFGEVWLAAGQSNMEWPVEASDVLAARRPDPRVRVFRIGRVSAAAPVADVEGRWVGASDRAARSASAVATAFAADLARKLDAPVGIVQGTWGGTRIESWISNAMLETVEESRAILDRYAADLYDFDDRLAAYTQATSAYLTSGAGRDLGRDPKAVGWESPRALRPEESVASEGEEFAGTYWAFGRLDPPVRWASDPWRLRLVNPRGRDRTFLDGIQIGASDYGSGRSYAVGVGVGRGGNPLLAVRLHDPFPAPISAPRVFLENLRTGEEREESPAWTFRIERAISPRDAASTPRSPLGPGHRDAVSGAYAGMIAPILPFAMRGTLFYQGESNADAPDLYRLLLRELIADWRTRAGEPKRPFLVVQLPSFAPGVNWPAVREAQAAAADLAGVEIVPTYDLGQGRTIHPVEKLAVGERAARIAANRVYGLGSRIRAVGPVRSEAVEGEMRVVFPAEAYLRTKTGEAPRGIEAAGEDRRFETARARLVGSSLYVSLPGERVAAVRYAWAPAPIGDLLGVGDAPVLPFRTDAWPLETATAGSANDR